MFYGTLLLFIAGAISSFNLPISFALLMVFSTGMHLITIRNDRKKRPLEHFTAWFLGVMAGLLVLGTLILPYYNIKPQVDTFKAFDMIRAFKKRELTWDISI